VADRKISELVALTSAVSANDALAIVDNSAAETKKIDPKTLLEESVKIIGAGTIPADKISGTTVPDGSVTTAKLADRAVTAEKLDDNSSGVVSAGAPAPGIRIGQVAVDTTDNKFYVWSGSQWLTVKGAGSVNEIVGDTTGPVLIGTTVTGDSVALNGSIEPTTNAAEFLAGPTSSGGAVTARPIIGDDLPNATSTSKGAVSVPGNGLKVNTGALAIDNTVVPNSAAQLHVVEYNEFGLVVSGRTIQGGDLPYAQPGVGGVIKPGTGLSVDADGKLNHTNVVTGGVGTKITFDGQGHVTGTTFLDAVDIPGLDAAKITSGAFSTAFLADHSVTGLKLADYATAYIQDTKPADTGNTIGQLWLNPLAQQIRMWDGNVWVPIGVGALSEQNLRFCGLFDATDGKITVVTKLGLDSGFKVGDVIPTMTDQLTGAYFVCNTPGNAVGQLPGVAFDAGDWIVGISVAVGWNRIDTLNSGGGGGGGTLDGLADVTLTTPGAGQVLSYNGASWVNTTLPSATDAVKGIIELATNAEVVAGTDTIRAVVPKTLADNYLAKNIATLPALP
jgi:hypothetical protein